MRDALLDALAVVLPVDCAGCGRPDRAICAGCRGALSPRPGHRSVAGFDVWSGLDYEGAPRRILLALKDRDRIDVARALAPALAGAVRAAPPFDRIVAVPSSARGRRRRGFDPVRIVARHAGLRIRCGLARSTRIVAVPRAVQKSLDRSGRVRNASGALRARGSFAGVRVLIVDDVVTTGATLAEAHRALVAAGATVVGAAVIASVPRHS